MLLRSETKVFGGSYALADTNGRGSDASSGQSYAAWWRRSALINRRVLEWETLVGQQRDMFRVIIVLRSIPREI